MANFLKNFFIKEEVVPEQIGVVFEPLDVDRVEKELKLQETAKQDGKKETPHTTETKIDSFQSKIDNFIEAQVSKRNQKLNENLIYLNKAIASSDVTREMKKAKNMVSLLKHDFESIVEQKRDELTESKENAEKIAKDFNNFKTKNKLKREPHYPESYETYVAVLLALLLLETIMNGVFFAKGNEYGYTGGTLIALSIASVNLAISFFLGRFTSYKNHIKNAWKCIGYLSSIVILLWVFSYNLMVAHYRQQLDVDITKAGSSAITLFLKSPFALYSFDYWVLFLIGLIFGLIAYGEGYLWNDKYPGYGQLDKRLKQAQDDFSKTLSEVRETTKEKKDQKLDELSVIESRINANISYMKEIVEQKHSLVKNLNNNIEQIESSSIALIKRYREINMQYRKTDPPNYFLKEITRQTHPIEKINFDKDYGDIKKQEEISSEFIDMVEGIKNSITTSYNQSFKSISDIDINWNKD